VPHFAHYHNKSDSQGSPECTYCEHPNESELHKNAKHKLASWLQQRRKITVRFECQSCRDGGSFSLASEVPVQYQD